jgi:hypothetical protein
VALVVKVSEGLVLAADSTVPLGLPDGGTAVGRRATTIFRLHPRYPLLGMTWGRGTIGDVTVATLVRDLAVRLAGGEPRRADWALDDGWTVEAVAQRLVARVYDEAYTAAYGGSPDTPTSGFLVAGRSPGAVRPECWTVETGAGRDRPVPRPVLDGREHGCVALAQREPVLRLLGGCDPALNRLLAAALPSDLAPLIMPLLAARERQIVDPVTPLGDAVERARYLAATVVGYVTAFEGPGAAGGPLQIATVSRDGRIHQIDEDHRWEYL